MNEWRYAQPPVAWRTVIFARAGSPLVTVRAELARDNAAGLMGRTELPEGQGMLFDMGQNSMHRFWMKGVPIALDIVFLFSRGPSEAIVSSVVENAQPQSETFHWGSGRWVLEVPGGWAARHSIRVGQRVDVGG
jgi:hypothetical protein